MSKTRREAMADQRENAQRQDKLARGIEERGIAHDVILPVLNEAKPIAEAVAAGLTVHKLTQGKEPPPKGGNEKG
jgi:hypothetical protein